MTLSSGPPPSNASPFRVVSLSRIDGERTTPQTDCLAAEEPMEIRLSYVLQGRRRQRTVSVTMRTPGHDRELAAGFLYTEGIISSAHDILAMHDCRNGNKIRIHLRPEVTVDLARLKRHVYTSSSCGVCGKTSLEAVQSCIRVSLPENSPQVSPELIHSLPEKLRQAQAVFEQTGGLHASALFSKSGDLIWIREDVGRHNALDKVIGRALLTRTLPLSETILLVSGRASFELVQKAVMAGIPILAAVGAPSSLAVELAEQHGMTLLGFVRQNRFNLYCGSSRICCKEAPAGETPAGHPGQ